VSLEKMYKEAGVRPGVKKGAVPQHGYHRPHHR